MTSLPAGAPVGVVGAGAMGVGIAQVAAAAGHPVQIFDVSPEAAERGRQRLADSLAAQISRGRMERAEADSLLDRVVVTSTLDSLATCRLVIEAIYEDPAAKLEVFQQLEPDLEADAIICSNTSSLSISQLGGGLARPERFAGFHFFNPAPAMKLVEVVAGLATSDGTIDTLMESARAWGKVPVRARSTPGFIVNRIARPFYAEALALVEEGLEPATIDEVMRRGGGFRMGPCELMDLIGHDVNYAVTSSVFTATYNDPRFRPSVVQRELVHAGWTGQKAGRGFYTYPRTHSPADVQPEAAVNAAQVLPGVGLDGPASVDGTEIARSDGRSALRREADTGSPCIVFDLFGAHDADLLGYARSPSVPPPLVDRFEATVRERGLHPVELPDTPGLLVLRTVAMIVNEAFDAVHLRVTNESDADLAMVHGVNYPQGPLGWGRAIGLDSIVAVIDNLHAETGDPRYRCSMRLRREAVANTVPV